MHRLTRVNQAPGPWVDSVRMSHRPFLVVALGGVAIVAGAIGPLVAAAPIDVPGRVLVGAKPAANVVVWLEAPHTPRVLRTVVLDQRNLAFDPGVVVTSVGSTVEFPNSDRVLHNVFSFRDGKRFDLGLYPVGKSKRIVFDRPGVSRLFCNIHPRMAAYVVVVDSPFYALTDGEGEFLLQGVPAGDYTYQAWRADGGDAVSNRLTIDAGSRVEILWPAR